MTDGSKKVRNTAENVRKDPASFLVDALMVGSDNAIELQELQGQVDLAGASSLPVKMGGARPVLESWGFRFGPHDGKDLFIGVTMPAEWKVVPTDHPLHSRLLDAKDRERATIFYKAAFYDRDAYLSLTTRFSVRKKYDQGNAVVVEVHDGDAVIHSIPYPPPLDDLCGREARVARYAEEDAIYQSAVAWLKERYPDYENPAAYWD